MAFPVRQLCHALLPRFGALGTVQPVVDGEQALAFEIGVDSVGVGVLLQRRQKVFRYHHGGAAGVGGGPAPVIAGGLYLCQAGGLQKKIGGQTPLGLPAIHDPSG